MLSGINSSGKSSVLQAILTLRQSYQQNLLPDRGLALNGELVNIGRGRDALFEGATDDFIEFSIVEFSIEQNNYIDACWRFRCYAHEIDTNVLQLSYVNNKQQQTYIYSSIFGRSFHYVQAERIGSRSYFKMSNFQVRQSNKLGTNGEYTGHFLAVNEKLKICDSRLSHPHVKTTVDLLGNVTPSFSLVDQVEAMVFGWQCMVKKLNRMTCNYIISIAFSEIVNI